MSDDFSIDAALAQIKDLQARGDSSAAAAACWQLTQRAPQSPQGWLHLGRRTGTENPGGRAGTPETAGAVCGG
jgi:hypothetical protein